jgi:GT2 family glycosyltransferase
MALPKVSIIILNWNNWKDLIECIESVFQINYSNFDVILIDNGSTNDSVWQIKHYFNMPNGKKLPSLDIFPLQSLPNMIVIDLNSISLPIIQESGNKSFFLIETKKNLGFSEGNNVGIRFSCKNLNPDYVLLLNNDVIVDSNFLNELVQAAETMPNVGFTGPKIYYNNYHGRQDIINFAGADIDFKYGTSVIYGIDQIDEGQLDDQKIVDWVQGACILVKNGVIKDIGLLDPEYFFYWEEIDWCIRGKRSNWLSLYAPAALIWHKGGMSSANAEKTFKLFYFTRNRLIFMKKNSNPRMFLIFIFYYFGFEFVKICANYIIQKDFTLLRIYLTANLKALIRRPY